MICIRCGHNGFSEGECEKCGRTYTPPPGKPPDKKATAKKPAR